MANQLHGHFESTAFAVPKAETLLEANSGLYCGKGATHRVYRYLRMPGVTQAGFYLFRCQHVPDYLCDCIQ